MISPGNESVTQRWNILIHYLGHFFFIFRIFGLPVFSTKLGAKHSIVKGFEI